MDHGGFGNGTSALLPFNAELYTSGVHSRTGSGNRPDFTQSLRIGSGRVAGSPNFPKFVLKI